MRKKSLESGTVFSIKLNHNLGYTFAKVVNLTDFAKDDLSNTFHLIVYPYNYVVDNENDYKQEDFIKSEPLTGPLFVEDILYSIKNKIYKIVGNTELKSYEKKVPAFRGFSAMVYGKIHYYEDEATDWNYFERGSPFKRIVANYNQVKHLEDNVALSNEFIERRLTMEVLSRSGKNLKDFYKLENWEELCVYNNMIYKTPFNQVPDNLKGIVEK